MLKNDKVLAMREAGAVLRAHNVRHHSDYPVGHHSYDVASIILCLYPGTPRIELIKAALWHDAPERWLGDVPAVVKWHYATLANEYRFAERRVLAQLGEEKLVDVLTNEEIWWLKSADRLELLLWARDQLAMGNKHAQELHDNVVNWLDTNADGLPQEIVTFLEKEPKWRRLPEDILGRKLS